jgi:uncharacterized protein YndB with AHSA1/START domain
MIKWILRLCVLVVALLAVTAGIGWFLPVGHQATRTVVLPAPPADVFARLRDVERYPEWRTDVTRVEVLDTTNGLPRFRETGEFGPIVFRMEQADAPTFMRTRIDDPDQPFGGSWTYVLVPENGGTRVTITEDGEVYNLIFRFLSRFVFSQSATIETYMGHLERTMR